MALRYFIQKAAPDQPLVYNLAFGALLLPITYDLDVFEELAASSQWLATTDIVSGLYFSIMALCFIHASFYIFCLGYKLIRNIDFDSLSKYVFSYLDAGVAFANIYAALQLLELRGNFRYFSHTDGCNDCCDYISCFSGEDRTHASFEIYLDSIFFSFSTLTTLGFSGLNPNNWISQSLVMAEVFVGLYIVVIGVSRFLTDHTDG